MSSCIRNKRDSKGENDAHIRYSPSATSLKRLFIGYIDFNKAFDSIHDITPWKIMRNYELPQKIVDHISILYQNFDGRVLMKKSDKQVSVRSGIRQGCLLSPILFNIGLDYLMRKTTQRAQMVYSGPFSHN